VGWWQRLVHAGADAPAAAVAQAPDARASVESEEAAPPASLDPTEPPAPLLPWLMQQPRPAPGDVSTLPELRALALVDALLARPAPGDWLPRARSVVPQLLAMLRREDIGSEAVAQQMGRDAALVAQVLRLASSAVHGASDRPPSLRQALDRIGRVGLNSAIANVVMQPMFSPDGQGLAARAGARLWQHAESKAEHGAALASEHGIDPFEGYLAGLLHNCGLTIALHEIDRRGLFGTAAASPCFTAAFSDALRPRCDRLFGLAAAAWQITPTLSALAAACVDAVGLRTSPLPLAQLLRLADERATRELAGTA